MAEKIKVEGYDVLIERAEGKFVVSVPELPGCAVQVDDKNDAPRAISQMIGLYLGELASRRPANMRRKPDEEGGSARAKGNKGRLNRP